MVFYKAKTDKLPLTKTPPCKYTAPTKPAKNSHQLVASIFFNVIMLAMLVGAGIYLMHQRRQLCDMQIQYESERLEELGIPHEVKHCHADPKVADTELPAHGLREVDYANEGVVELDDSTTPPPLPTEEKERRRKDNGNKSASPKKKEPAAHHRGHEGPPPKIAGDDHSSIIGQNRPRHFYPQRVNVGQKPKNDGESKNIVVGLKHHQGLHRPRDKSTFNDRHQRDKTSDGSNPAK